MIDAEEFERRASQWLGLALKALEKHLGHPVRDIRELSQIDRDNPKLVTLMKEADLYRLMYLPEKILAQHLDPLVMTGYFASRNRADFLLEQGIAQRNARRLALQAIAKAKASSVAYKHR